ncbi:MAG: GDP-mannose 4,6-dehydratase [Candidatus Roizmanbacteria bacterium]|nr:GDP-mannose 4,6-dehydratase [Candidatus Roizmanbacteria bacterium]
MNVLVTGGTGFVGGHLVEELLNLKANVTVVDISIDKKAYFFSKNFQKKTTVIQLDICNYKKLEKLVKDYKIDFIFHLAAQALVEEAYNNPKYTLENNIVSTINVLEVVRTNKNIKGVVVASSDKCYGKLHKEHYVETDPLSGDHPYDTSKSVTDLVSSTYYSTYKIPVIITRFGNIYGEGDLNFSRIVPGIMRTIIKGEQLELRSDGTYIRDYLYVKDVVHGYILLAQKMEELKGQAYNFGSDETLSVIELIKLVEKELKQKIGFTILNSAKNEIPYQSLDCTKIKKDIQWKQEYSFSSTINNIFSWYKKTIV